MYSILLSFFSICLLRMRPQDLPEQPVLAGIALALYLGSGTLIGLQSFDFLNALGVVLLDIGVLGGLLCMLLWIKELMNRFTQTITALLGSGAILELLALPLVIWQQQGLAAETIGTGTVIASLLLWLWLLWTLLVIGHILRHAVDTIYPFGVLLGLLYMFVTFSVTRSLFFSAVA